VQGEETEIIKISSDSFIIGRNEETVQFAANWIGLSRKHMEINRNGLEYEAKDLGSKNGSFLNDHPMIPHQSYLLNEGDQIKIVDRPFVYKKI
jgi:pSer/pThr/pTyr-binding forkhead associated (FHA) protein